MNIFKAALFAGAASYTFGRGDAYCQESSDKITCYGSSTLSSKNVEEVTAYGSIQINDCTISGLLQSFGASTVTSSNVGNLYSAGACSTQGSTIGPVQVFGLLTSVSSNFTGTMEITSTSATLSSSQTRDIIYHPTSPKDPEPQELTLQQGSTVNGDITFEEGNGKVYKSSDSTINGEVIGGDIIQKIKNVLRGIGLL